MKVWSDVLMAVRSKLLSLPSKIGPQLINESDTAIIVAKIRAEVYDALAELSEDQSGVTNGAEAAAASDDIGVVGQLS
jgi:hypothetical protein